MSAFQLGVDAIFADPNMAADALYTPPASAAVACRVIRRKPDMTAPLGTPGFQLGAAAQDVAWIFDVRKSEVAQPARGGTITYPLVDGAATAASKVYTVRAEPTLDDEGLVWTLPVGKPA